MKFSQAKRLLSNRFIFGASAITAGSVFMLRTQNDRRTFGSIFKPTVAFADKENKDDIVNNLILQEFSINVDKPGLSSSERAKINYKLKTRSEHLQHLKDPAAQFDILVIGGGCNGTGVVLDAASRGLKCAVIDSYDFAAGTSSKSTKLAHGGIRYFQQMCYLQGDPIESYNLLKETLNERNYFL